jgi:hypothetical protein
MATALEITDPFGGVLGNERGIGEEGIKADLQLEREAFLVDIEQAVSHQGSSGLLKLALKHSTSNPTSVEIILETQLKRFTNEMVETAKKSGAIDSFATHSGLEPHEVEQLLTSNEMQEALKSVLRESKRVKTLKGLLKKLERTFRYSLASQAADIAFDNPDVFWKTLGQDRTFYGQIEGADTPANFVEKTTYTELLHEHAPRLQLHIPWDNGERPERSRFFANKTQRKPNHLRNNLWPLICLKLTQR